MKKFYRILALLLALCLYCTATSAAGITEEEEHTHGIVEEGVEEAEEAELSMSVSVYEPAASTVETAEQGPQIPDRMTWTLDEDGTLRIGGKGIVRPITSADQQPWANVREQIKEVYFEDDARLMIESIAYWFDGCANLTYAELPAYVFAIGDHAFRNCTKLTELALFHAQTVEISSTAFEAAGASDLCVYVRNEEAYASASQAAWYGRSVAVVNLGEYPAATYSGYCMSGCNCSSCTWSWIIKQYDEDYHYKYAACDNCSANEYAYGTRIAHTFNSSGVCTECGYAQTVSCSHGSTYTTWSGCNWYRYCNYCDELLSSGVSHGTYTYGNWQYYSSTQHRRYGTCSDCGSGGKYEYASHSTTAQYTQYSDSQHKVTQHCNTCNSDLGSATYESHTYTYGAWASASATQHKRAKTCSLCGLSTEETGTHADNNSDGKCDTCGYSMSVTVTWDAGTNGGKVNGGNTVMTAVPLNTTAAAPSFTPTKTGYTFRGWYTAATGGSLYSTVTITAARTFYAQFTANTYTITWDLGDGRTETTQQEYGKVLVLPSDEPTRDTAYFDGWYTEKTGGAEVNEDTIFTEDSNTTYYAHWIEAFSVTVPTVLPLQVDENGEVYATEASISNHSSGIVKISSVTLTGENGWTIVPYGTNMAAEKVDAKLVGLSLNQIETASAGPTETLTLGESWRIFREDTLALTYDAVVSALSQPVTDEAILSAVFVVEWA